MKRATRPTQPWENEARSLALPKPQYREQPEPVDTSELEHRKIHPKRDDAFLRWLRHQPCAIAGKTDSLTGYVHHCWSPDRLSFDRFASDPAHCGKAFSGKLKRSDAEAIPLCRLAHRHSEMAMDEFDRRYEIDRFAIAEECYARYQKERGPKS